MQAHYFIGIPVYGRAKEELANWVSDHRNDLSFKKWAVPEDFHITLFFLGQAASVQIQQLKELLPQPAVRYKPFELYMSRFAYFGNESEPRVFYADIRPSQSLIELQVKVKSICEQVGFTSESRPYRPHITLARRWAGEKPFSLPSFSDQLTANSSWIVREFILYQSHMDRTPKYEPIARFDLKGEVI